MGSRTNANGSSGNSRTCISADDFVVMLRHLAEAHSRETSSTRSRAPRAAVSQQRAVSAVPSGSAGSANQDGAQQQTTPALWRAQLVRARLENAVQDVLDFISSVSVLLCLGALKLTLRIVRVSQTIAHLFERGFGGTSSSDGQVNKLTSVHWTVTSMIIQLQGLRLEMMSREKVVNDFISRHQISLPLSARVKQYVSKSQPQQICEANVEALRRLSMDLLLDLGEEMRVPAPSTHPFFISLRSKHPHLVRELCQEALQPMLKCPEEMVFFAGEQCSQMYFVANGNLQYTMSQPREQDARRPQDAAYLRRTLSSGQWLSEAALWTSWVHRGELRVITDSFLFALDASGFARVISSHKVAHVLAASYARKFVETLNRGPQTDLMDAAPVDQ